MVQPVYEGVSSLVTSGHLPPAPLNQTNTNPEMPESDNTNYTLQLLRSLPGAWEAAPRHAASESVYVQLVKGQCVNSFQIPFCRCPLCFFLHNDSVSNPSVQWLEAVQPLLRWHNISNACIWGEFVSA